MIPPIITSAFLLVASVAVGDSVYHSIGNPTDEEQYYLELINRARADPEAEGLRIAGLTDPAILYAIYYFGVDMNLFRQEMAALAPQPPLAMNSILIGVARSHSADMFEMGIQSHIGSNGYSWPERGIAANYDGSLLVENIYASSWYTEFGHAAFEIDWGSGGTGGMLPGRFHRNAIHYSDFREIGIGIFNGSKIGVDESPIGPQLVTQDFGTGPAGTAFITGVVFYDLNENNFYNPGEGIGGVDVVVGDGAHLAVTASSGGFSVPVPAEDASHEVTFIGPGIRTEATAIISGGANVKVDLMIPYHAPMVTGTTVPAVGVPARYEVSPVAGAISYDWRVIQEIPAANDPAENLDQVTPEGAGLNPMCSDSVRFQGSQSYHLFHEGFGDCALVYKSSFQVGPEAEMTFRSRHAYASSGQVATVQVIEDGSSEWTTLWSQPGSDDAGEVSFNLRSVPFDAYTGREVRLRFLYDYLPGYPAYFFPIGQPVGWYVDDVRFSGLTIVSGERVTGTEVDRSFQFTPETEARYRLSSRPVFPDRTGSFGESLPVDASNQNSYGDWASVNEFALELPAGKLSRDPEGDLNGDGIADVMAYALGLDPMAIASKRLPIAKRVGGQIEIIYQSHSLRSDVTWGPEASHSLDNWATPGNPAAPPGFADEILEVNGGTVTRRAILPIIPGNSACMRMKATLGEETGS